VSNPFSLGVGIIAKVKVQIGKDVFELDKEELKTALKLMGKALCGKVTIGCVVACAKLVGDNPRGFMWTVKYDNYDSFLENIKEIRVE